MRRLRGFLTLIGVLCVLSLAGCGLPWPFPQPTPDPKLPDAQQILRPLESGPNAGGVDSLDPAQIQFGFDYGMAQLIFPQLVMLDENQQPVDWAAESHEISADGLTYTFHLRKGMAWSDGTPIDATTFAYSINRTLDPCTGSSSYLVAFYLYDLAGAEAFNTSACPTGVIKSTATLVGSSIQTPDPLTLRLQLAHPTGSFLAKLTWPTSWAVPQALIEQYGQVNWTNHLTDHGPFGGNLYLLTAWQRPTGAPDGLGRLSFERNGRFWGKKPLLRRIEYTLYGYVTAEWNDFAQGKGDVSSVPPTEFVGARAMKGAIVQQTPLLTYWYVAFNWQIAPFDDARVRQAFSLALDRTTLGPEALRVFRQPTIHLVPEGMPGYNPDLTNAVGRKGKDALTPDLDAARKLASAYAAEKCSGDYSKCPAIYFAIEGSIRETVGQPAVDQWRQAFPGWGIQTTQFPHMELKTFSYLQLALGGWTQDYPDPQDFLSLLWKTGVDNNLSHVSVPQVDALLSQADGMNDQTARLPLYQQAEQLLVNQGAAIPLYQTMAVYAMRSRVVGWRIAPTGVTPLSVWQQVYIKR